MEFMNRDQWEFEYTANKLSEAAQAQKDYRDGRVKVWEEKKAEIMTKIKDSGLTVHESPGEKLSTASNNYNTRAMGRGVTVMVDPMLQRDMDECMTKIEQHREASKSYDGWIQVLNANSEARLKLKHNDWMYFFGK